MKIQAALQFRTLVVDDHHLVLQVFADFLAFSTDLEIVGMANGGKNALELCARFNPDLVIMDQEMPIMDGISACREMKILYPFVIVIILSTFSDQDRQQEAIEAGADYYLPKENTHALLEILQGIQTAK